MKNFQLQAKILSQTKIKDNYWHCELSAPQVAKNALPGQFINIRVSDNFDPLLRRPISIYGVSGAKIKIFYEVVGKATEILAQKKKGEFLDIVGPLGRGFSFNLRTQELKNLRTIIVAGGIGVAPLVFLAEKLKNTKPLVLIGARTKKEILCAREFKALGCEVKIATDDGSRGFKGKVTDLLAYLLSAIDYRPLVIYSCGPRLMLKAVAQIAGEHKINAQLSLEEHMACGMGACLGCVVAAKSGYKTVCKDGPVFSSEELVW
ncbi:MAG: dihydroorotate dehydrogenase electron transfer subunit [Candidatus Omnitrophica bacterium]|nr:dihydroorotate dehydrogenase electron transfer subunit [Candidatus Omnitrophota bacterium]